MTIWGRLIGTILGYKLLGLGLFGGLIGFLVGAWFDRSLRIHLHQAPRKRTEEVQNAFFTTTFSVMGHLAKADGRVSENEIRAAQKLMTQLELNDELKQDAIRLFNEGKEQNFNLAGALTHLYQVCYQDRDLLRFFIEIQVDAALADGELQPEERKILLLICEKLHFSPREFEDLWARQWASQAFYHWFSGQFDPNTRTHNYNDGYNHRERTYARRQTESFSLHDAYGVLGVSPSDSIADIKKAYRRLMNQHHPDKLASRGLPEGMVKVAKEKTQQIRAAYDLIRKERGFR